MTVVVEIISTCQLYFVAVMIRFYKHLGDISVRDCFFMHIRMI